LYTSKMLCISLRRYLVDDVSIVSERFGGGSVATTFD